MLEMMLLNESNKIITHSYVIISRNVNTTNEAVHLPIFRRWDVQRTKEVMEPYKKNENTKGTKAGFMKIKATIIANAVRKIRQKLLILAYLLVLSTGHFYLEMREKPPFFFPTHHPNLIYSYVGFFGLEFIHIFDV